MANSETQDFRFSLPRSSKRKPKDNDAGFGAQKRRKVESTETSEPHFSTVEGNSKDDVKGSKSFSEEKNQREMDRGTRLQCWVMLKRLMIHPDGRAFKELTYSNDLGDSEVMGLGTIESKLIKNIYSKADEFAADIRLMFSTIMLNPPNIRGIYRMAQNLRREFEERWKSLKERWDSENGENKSKQVSVGKQCPKVPTLSQHNFNWMTHKLVPSRKVRTSVSRTGQKTQMGNNGNPI